MDFLIKYPLVRIYAETRDLSKRLDRENNHKIIFDTSCRGSTKDVSILRCLDEKVITIVTHVADRRKRLRSVRVSA
jgi:hypothetical protein